MFKKSKMPILIFAAVLFLSGCSTFNALKNTNSNINIIQAQEHNFAGALQYLRNGKEQKAIELFELVISGPDRQGITDEALFRLAVLNLRDSGAKSALRAEKLLERLKKSYPYSIWKHQADPLLAFIESSTDLKKSQKELKSLRELNTSLIRNNRELRQAIEQLKELDIELENKTRR